MLVRRVRLLSLPVMSLFLLSASVHAQDKDLEAAKAAWQRRNDLVRSVRVTLSEDVTIHRGYYVALYEGLPRAEGGKDLVPVQDVHDSHPSTLTISNNNFKYAYSGKQWSSARQRMEPLDYIAISTRDVRSFFFDDSSHSGRRPQLSLSDRPNSDELLLKLIPLMLALRSGQPNHRKLADYMLTGEIVVVEGRDCVELITGSQKGKAEYMYLDPKRDWTVRRIDGYTNGKLTRRITAEYAADPVAGWLPSAWSYVTRAPDGTPLESGKLSAKYEVNVEIPDNEFTPKYPPGTFVVDDRKGPRKETVSIIKQDGSPGVELPLSQRPTDEQLLRANEPPRKRTWRYWLLAGTVLVLGMATLLWYRRRRRAADSGTGGSAAGSRPEARPTK